MTPGSFVNSSGNREGYSAGSGTMSNAYKVFALGGDRWTLLIDTATNNEDYGVNLTSPVVDSITITADGSTTKPEIAGALAAAWNADPGCSRYATAISDGVATVTFWTVDPDVVIAEDENAAKMTLTHATVDTGAVVVPAAPRWIKLRAKLSNAATFDPTADDVTVFLAADAAGDIPITNAKTEVCTPGKTTPSTKGGVSFDLERIAEGNHDDRVSRLVFVVAKLEQGTADVVWYLDHEDGYGSGL